MIIYIPKALKLKKYSKSLYKIWCKNIKSSKQCNIIKIKNIKMFKLLKILKQLVNQLELKLGLKKWLHSAVSQKWPVTGKGTITKGFVSFSSQTKLKSQPFSGLIQIFQRASRTFQSEMSPLPRALSQEWIFHLFPFFFFWKKKKFTLAVSDDDSPCERRHPRRRRRLS